MAYARTYPLDSLLNLMEQFCHLLPNELDYCALSSSLTRSCIRTFALNVPRLPIFCRPSCRSILELAFSSRQPVLQVHAFQQLGLQGPKRTSLRYKLRHVTSQLIEQQKQRKSNPSTTISKCSRLRKELVKDLFHESLKKEVWYVYLLARHMQFPAKAKKSYAVYKIIKPARLVQKCFETSILVQGSPAARTVLIGGSINMFL